MAVEDGFAIGKLLGLLNTTSETATGSEPQAQLIADILDVYEQIRKARTTRNVQAAARNRMIFHIPDGIVQAVRDFVLGYAGMTRKSDWTWLFSARMRSTLYHDLAGECETGFTECRISGQR